MECRGNLSRCCKRARCDFCLRQEKELGSHGSCSAGLAYCYVPLPGEAAAPRPRRCSFPRPHLSPNIQIHRIHGRHPLGLSFHAHYGVIVPCSDWNPLYPCKYHVRTNSIQGYCNIVSLAQPCTWDRREWYIHPRYINQTDTRSRSNSIIRL